MNIMMEQMKYLRFRTLNGSNLPGSWQHYTHEDRSADCNIVEQDCIHKRPDHSQT